MTAAYPQADHEKDTITPAKQEARSTASPRADDVLAAARAAEEAASLVLARSSLWLALHPLQHRRLRRDVQRKRDRLIEVRSAWRAAGRPA